MEFSKQFILFALFLPLVSCVDPIYEKCSQNFTNNDALQSNINKVIYELIANTPSKGYAISSSGDGGNNTVYGLTRCRGDIESQACSECIVAASQKLQAICPNTAASRIWYEFCSIRYDTYNFIGSLDISDIHGWIAIKETVNPQEFNSDALKLLNWVKVSTSLGSNKFGIGEISTVDEKTIYGMAQCTHDLQGLVCMQCLETLTVGITTSCKNHDGCNFICSSCLMRYEIYNFLLAESVPIYPGSGALPPASAPAPVASTLV